jgi:hypothetical protein
MAAIIDKKDFSLNEDILRELSDFVGPYIDRGFPVDFVVLVKKPDELRQNKSTALETLRSLVAQGEVSYIEHGYKFDFYTGSYYWKGTKVYITAGEALFLYRWLVLSQYERSQLYFIHNMRKRYGNEFLQEVIHD